LVPRKSNHFTSRQLFYDLGNVPEGMSSLISELNYRYSSSLLSFTILQSCKGSSNSSSSSSS
jgi:hypothetical protein